MMENIRNYRFRRPTDLSGRLFHNGEQFFLSEKANEWYSGCSCSIWMAKNGLDEEPVYFVNGEFFGDIAKLNEAFEKKYEEQ